MKSLIELRNEVRWQATVLPFEGRDHGFGVGKPSLAASIFGIVPKQGVFVRQYDKITVVFTVKFEIDPARIRSAFSVDRHIRNASRYRHHRNVIVMRGRSTVKEIASMAALLADEPAIDCVAQKHGKGIVHRQTIGLAHRSIPVSPARQVALLVPVRTHPTLCLTTRANPYAG